MKKIYKITLGVGATTVAASSAVAAVYWTKANNHKEAQKADSKNLSGAIKTSIQAEEKHLPATQVISESQSRLLSKLKELKVADEADTQAQFDSNLEGYTVKLLDVLSSSEDALDAKDTEDLLNAIIAHYQSGLTTETKDELLMLSGFVSEFIVKNHLLSNALKALEYNPQDGDTDFLEKLDGGHIDFTKAIAFASQTIKGIPSNIDAQTTKHILNLIKSFAIPPVIKDLFPTNSVQAMQAWSGVLNSGIIQEVGTLISDVFSKGVGNINFDELKGKIDNLIKSAEQALISSNTEIMGFSPAIAAAMIETLKIPTLIDVVKDVVTEGVFGLGKDLVDELKAIKDSPLFSIVISQIDGASQYVDLITDGVNLVGQLDSGIANVKQEDFEKELNEILSLIPGASVSEDIKSLFVKALYNGWATQEEFDKFVKSLLPDSILNLKFTVSGKDIVLGKIIMDMLNAMYTGKELKLDDWLLQVAKGAGIDTSVSKDMAEGVSPLLQKGLFALSKDETKNLFLALKKFSGQMLTLLQHPLVAPKLPESAKPLLEGTIEPILNILRRTSQETMTQTAYGVYDLLNHGISSAATDFRTALPQVFNIIKSSRIDLPPFIEPIIFAAVNGVDSLTAKQAQMLVDWISTLIPKDTPILSSNEFIEQIYVAIMGKEKLLEINKEKAEKIKLSAQSRAAISAENKRIDEFVATHPKGTASAETFAKTAKDVKLEEIIAPVAPKGLIVVPKSFELESSTKMMVTYTVSSELDGTKTVEFKSEIEGFKISEKLTYGQVIAKLKELMTSMHITDKTPGRLALTLISSFKEMLIQNFPEATTQINALSNADMWEANSAQSNYDSKGLILVLLRHTTQNKFSDLLSIEKEVENGKGFTKGSLSKVSALFKALDA